MEMVDGWPAVGGECQLRLACSSCTCSVGRLWILPLAWEGEWFLKECVKDTVNRLCAFQPCIHKNLHDNSKEKNPASFQGKWLKFCSAEISIKQSHILLPDPGLRLGQGRKAFQVNLSPREAIKGFVSCCCCWSHRSRTRLPGVT